MRAVRPQAGAGKPADSGATTSSSHFPFFFSPFHGKHVSTNGASLASVDLAGCLETRGLIMVERKEGWKKGGKEAFRLLGKMPLCGSLPGTYSWFSDNTENFRYIRIPLLLVAWSKRATIYFTRSVCGIAQVSGR